MGKRPMMGYDEALTITLESIFPIRQFRDVGLDGSLDRVVYRDIHSLVDSPCTDASMKDGYAIRSTDIEQSGAESNIQLIVTGTSAAGAGDENRVFPGTAVRILTGAGIPDGADAVLSEEFSERHGNRLTVFNTAGPGRNILPGGADVRTGELVAKRGCRLSPGLIGILAAAGLARVPVYRRLKIAILATGDELVRPGQRLGKGKLYASNLEMLKAWLLRYGMENRCLILNDHPGLITRQIADLISSHDALVTSGGAWTGDRDFVAAALDSLGWEKRFHYIRIGPGKAVGFGLLNQKPVFMLPGGPPSNLTAFLQIALPGLLRLGGHCTLSLPRVKVALSAPVKSRQSDWTQFIYGTFADGDRHTLFEPINRASRLKSMASAQAVVAVPEGVDLLPENAVVSAQLLI